MLKEGIINLSKAAKGMGLSIGLQNTKCMEVMKRPRNSKMLDVNGKKYERARECK
jgi:hypothetical protein